MKEKTPTRILERFSERTICKHHRENISQKFLPVKRPVTAWTGQKGGMMKYVGQGHLVFTISGKLPGLNEYIKACRTGAQVGAKMKKEQQKYVAWFIPKARPFTEPVIIKITYFEPNKRRDPDNISGFARKVIFDALVKSGILKDDGQDEIKSISESWKVDKNDPCIIVEIFGKNY